MVFYGQKTNKPKRIKGIKHPSIPKVMVLSKKIYLELKPPPLHHEVSMQILILLVIKMPINMRSSAVRFVTKRIILA